MVSIGLLSVWNSWFLWEEYGRASSNSPLIRVLSPFGNIVILLGVVNVADILSLLSSINRVPVPTAKQIFVHLDAAPHIMPPGHAGQNLEALKSGTWNFVEYYWGLFWSKREGKKKRQKEKERERKKLITKLEKKKEIVTCQDLVERLSITFWPEV